MLKDALSFGSPQIIDDTISCVQGAVEHCMVVRITRLLLLLQTAIAAGFFLLAVKVLQVNNLWLGLAFGITAVLLLRLAITTNNFYLAWTYRSETPAAFRLNWRQVCGLFLGEFSATLISSSWTMPFHTFRKRIAKNPACLPVLLIHGYGCNSGYWHSMSKVLMHANITHYAVDMEPVFGTIDAYAPIVHDTVEAMCTDTGHDRIVIVAHSMGGLAARAYLRDHGSTRIARIITLGTPHYGTGLANFGPGINSQQMRWKGNGQHGKSSSWLHQLADREDCATSALFVSIYSHHDNIISPQTSSFLPGAKNIEVHGIGHVALALDPTIQTKVIEEIRLASQVIATMPAKKSA